MDFCITVLSPIYLKYMIIDNPDKSGPQDGENTILLLKDPFINEVKQIMHQYPFIFATWNLKDPIGELKDEFEFQRYINEVKVNFSTE